MAPSVPLVNPSTYYQREDRPSLVIGAGIVLVVAVAHALLTGGTLVLIIDQVNAPPEAKAVATGAGVFGVFVGFFARLLGWAFLSIVAHVFLMIWDGAGDVDETFAIVGEAEIVGLVALPLQFGLIVFLLMNLPADPAASEEAMREILSSRRPVLVALTLGATAWKAVIQGIGLGVVHGVSKWKTLVLMFVLGAVIVLPSVAL